MQQNEHHVDTFAKVQAGVSPTETFSAESRFREPKCQTRRLGQRKVDKAECGYGCRLAVGSGVPEKTLQDCRGVGNFLLRRDAPAGCCSKRPLATHAVQADRPVWVLFSSTVIPLHLVHRRSRAKPIQLGLALALAMAPKKVAISSDHRSPTSAARTTRRALPPSPESSMEPFALPLRTSPPCLNCDFGTLLLAMS